MMRKALGLALLVAFGCGSDGGGNNPPGGDAPPGDGPGPMPDAFVPPSGFTKLIGASWTVPAGVGDRYRCARFTVQADTYITNIIAEAPSGTHHTVLSISDSSTAGADGEYDCSVNTLGMVMIYASGVGTSPLDFPNGVSVKVAAGTQVHLNLHLFNATDNPINGSSAIHIKSQSTPTATLAEMVFAGRFAFAIPANNPSYNVVGGCTVNSPYTLFAVWPHMHQIATHQKVELIRGANTSVLHDMNYSFSEQNYWLQNPEVQVQNGDQIRVTCTYNNNTGQIVTFGDSSNKEMCFTGLYRYPAANAGLFQCTDQPGF